MIHEPEMIALEARAHAARITMPELCKRAGKFRQSWYRARKRGRAEYTLFYPLEQEMAKVEAERQMRCPPLSQEAIENGF